MPVTVADQQSTTPVPEPPLPLELLRSLYETMLRAKIVAKNSRTKPSFSAAVIAGTLAVVSASDVIFAAGEDPVFTALMPSSLQRFSSDSVSLLATPAGFALASKIAQPDRVVVAFVPGKRTAGTGWQSAAEFASQNKVPCVVFAARSAARNSSRVHDGSVRSEYPFP